MCCAQTLPLRAHANMSTWTDSTNYMRIIAIDSTNCIFVCVELQHASNQLHIIKSRTQDNNVHFDHEEEIDSLATDIIQPITTTKANQLPLPRQALPQV